MSKRGSTGGSERRAKVVVTLEEKREALDLLRDGATVATVSQKYGVGETTVRDWRKAEATIRRDAATVGCAGKVKIVKRPSHRSMEQRLFEWIRTTRLSRGNLTQATICQKACDFYHELNQGPDYCHEFNASSSWFRRFCQRFSLDLAILFGQTSKPELFVEDPSSHSLTYDEDRKIDTSLLGAAAAAAAAAAVATGGGNPSTGETLPGSADSQVSCDEGSVTFSPDQILNEDTDPSKSTSPAGVQRPESYKLRHNNHFNLVLESLAGDESFMDVTLTAEGRAIKAHKSVLSAVSPYFKSVLKENPCQHPIIIMPRDIRFEELNNIIAYVYKGEMTVAVDALPSLLKTAEVLEVSGLTPSDSGGSFPPTVLSSPAPNKKAPRPSTQATTTSSSSSSFLPTHLRDRMQAWYSDGLIPNPSHSENQDKIDPQDFLTADMTCIKEEISSDTEDNINENSNAMPESENMDTPPLTIGTNSDEPPPPPDPPEVVHGDLESSHSSCFQSSNDSPTTTADPFTCPYCLETHRPSSSLQTHLRLKHASKPSFMCHQCYKVFTRQSSHDQHARSCEG